MVEWKKLGELCCIRTGKLNANAQVENGQYPFFTCDAKPFKIDKYAFDTEAIMISGNGSQVGHINYYKGKFNAYQRTYVIDGFNNINVFYLLHYLKGTMRSYVMEKSKKGSVPYITLPMLVNFCLPIPSLEEQNRIVGILDTFTDSIKNLKQQIAQRRKQYEHYRDQLLDLEGKEGVEWKKLNTVCEVINGRAYKQQELLAAGKYRVLRVGNFFSNDSWYFSDLELDDKYYCNDGDLLYAWSASFGPHIWTEEKTIYHYHIWKMNCCEELEKKYMFYWLQSENMRKQAFSHLHGATMAHLTKALIESLNVPLLPLPEQQRIVSILDTFEASISNLEAQLEQRQKQYEYYRNQLLTFE